MSRDELAFDMIRSTVIMLLYEKPLHGYGVMKSLKTRLGKNISPSIVYPFLHQLEEKGLLHSSMKPVGKKPKKVYELTKEGKTLATTLFKRLASLVSIAIEPSLDVCAHCGAKIFEGGHKEVIDDREIMFCCVHCYQAYNNDRGRERHRVEPTDT